MNTTLIQSVLHVLEFRSNNHLMRLQNPPDGSRKMVINI